MKKLIAFIVAVLLAITVLVCMADTNDFVETQETIGFNVKGQVGVKLDQNVCLNPNNGQVEICF